MQETQLTDKDRYYLRVKGWQKAFQENGLKNEAGVAILISDKIDFQPKVFKWDGEVHFILIKGKIHQEKVSIPYIYVPSARALNICIKFLLKLKYTFNLTH